jgi:hypothetical protein
MQPLATCLLVGRDLLLFSVLNGEPLKTKSVVFVFLQNQSITALISVGTSICQGSPRKNQGFFEVSNDLSATATFGTLPNLIFANGFE